MHALRSLAIATLAACSLAACTSSTLPLPSEKEWTQHQAELQRLENWQFSGKLAVVTRNGAETARINWQQTGAQTRLTLSGPVGWGRATVSRDRCLP